MVKPIMYHRPNLLLFQRFTLEKMEWPNHYACEKLLVLLTRYDLIDRKLGRKNSNQLQPIRIVKPRVRTGVHCLEIEWEKPEHYAMEDTQPGELTVLTIEEKSLFEAAYPEMVAAYQKQQSENKGKKQKSMKMKPKGNNLTESDDVINFQSFMTLKPTCKIFSEQNTKINSGISSDPILPQEPISPSLNNLAYPEDAPCLNLQEQFMPYPRHLTVKQIKDVSKSLISECSQPSTSSHNNSGIANLHLSSIDWEGTSFSNSPAVQRITFSHDPPLELESEPSAILHGFEKIPEHLMCESEQHPTNCHGKLDGNLQQISHEEHLLPGIDGLCLQDLPLKERIHIKSTYPQYNVQPEVDLKILSLLKVKGSYIADSNSDGSSHLSKDLPGMHLHQESRNPKVLKDQLLQKTFEVNASIPYFLKNSVVKTSSVQVEPPNSAVHHSTKADMKTSKKIVMKNSVCLERNASDEESAPIFGKAKYTTPKMKHSSVMHDPAQHKESDHNKFSNPKIDSKKTELCFQSCKTTENEEHWFSHSVKRTQLLLQSPKKNEDSGTCLDSPLPLCQRLKLRFQNT